MKAVVTLGVPSPVLSAVDDRSGPNPIAVATKVLKSDRLRAMRRGAVARLKVGAGLVMVVASVLAHVQGELRRVVTVRANSPAVMVTDQDGNAAPSRVGFALVQEGGRWVRLQERWSIYHGRDPRRERSARRRWDPRRHRRGRG